jgi:RHS repeat-associated protein
MRWDFKDQLQATSQQVVNNGGTPEITYYVYDASGQRVRKVTERQAGPGQTPTRLKERMYLGGFEIYCEYAGDGQTVTLARETLHLMDDQQRIALVETRTQGNDGSPPRLIRYQFGNHLGSASLELDDQAQIISYEEYTPYGSTSYQAVRSQTETPKRYRYTGKERDEETGLYYHGARYYAAWLGRWVSCDPVGLVDGRNLYRFVQNAPTRLIDQTGNDSDDPTSLPQPQGFGLSFGGGKVRIGPLTPPPQTVCDELNPACSGLTLNLNQSKPGESADTSQQSGADPSQPFDPFKALKIYAPGKERSVPLTNPLKPEQAEGIAKAFEQRFGQPPKGIRIIGSHAEGTADAASDIDIAIETEVPNLTKHTGEGFEFFKDINPGRVPPGVKGIGAGPDEAFIGDAIPKPGTIDPFFRAPGEVKPPSIQVWPPPQAVEGAGVRALRGAARGLFWVGVAFTAYDLGAAAVESFGQGSIKPLAREVVRQSVTWGAAIGGAKLGAIIGSAFGPVGTVVGGLIGGILGGIGGWIAGSWLSSLF